MTGIAPLPQIPQGLDEPWANFSRDLAAQTQRGLTVLVQGTQRIGAPVVLTGYTVSQLTASPAAVRPSMFRVVYCTDLSGTSAGAPVYSDSVTWRRFSDNTVVS